MNKVKWYGAILALFFVLMGAATVYSCITSRNHLPLVSLALPETVEDGCYRVPNQAVQEQGYRHLFVVEEQQGCLGQGVCLSGDPAAKCQRGRAEHPDLY